ncbi:tetratricopeptide repeat protein [Lewinella sp. W8]|uniref:tetratricopeptide repeat protein n=1 Tax=Lewinella sp. W8 TaxID=2528208 RepID=UPI0010685D3A|nr:tetratricopeptide repeat protein [Lewinella sp. W8]MTB49385.1 tetratricopeptide repeat protein [Lewinella sp. W8]
MAKQSKQKKRSTEANKPGPAWYRAFRFQLLAVIVLSAGVYLNTLGHEYALDDAIVITDNVIVQKGIAGWGELFTYDTFYGFFQDEDKAQLVAGGRYRPLTPAMFALEQQLFGGPTAHHLFNVLWYALLCAVIFGFVRDISRGRKELPWWFAVATAILFAVHPLHTEAVANIKGRDEIVALLGVVAGSWLVWRAAVNERWLGAVAGAGLFFLGCLAKENAITFLAVIPAMLFLVRGKDFRWAELKYYLPVVALAGLFLVIRSRVIGFSLGEPVMELLNNPFLELRDGQWVPLSAGDRLATVMHTLWEYLRLLFAPYGLVHDYYPRAIPVMDWASLTPWLGLLLHLGLGLFVVLKFRQFPLAALGIVIYLASLSIVSNVFFSVGTNMSERFLFMPSLGWALAVTVGVATLVRRFGGGLAWLVPVVALVFSVLTINRNPVWKNNFTLFTTDVEKQPNSAKLLNASGGVRLDRYQSLPETSRANQQQLLLDARRDLTRATEIHPTYRNAFLLRGNAELLLKNYDAAIADYDHVLDLDGGYQPARDNMLRALTAAGRAAGEERGDLNAAFGYLRRAEQLAPNDYETLRLLGVASGVSGRTQEAVEYFRRAYEVQPENADAIWNYGAALYQNGQPELAEEYFGRAEAINPNIRSERMGLGQ